MKRSYTELMKLPTLKERYEYLSLSDKAVGEDTFGVERYLNQGFYASSEWRKIRREVIIRDQACELGLKDCPITGKVIIHHLNPITISDVTGKTNGLLDPDNLVCVSHNMHNAIHYGSSDMLPDEHKERTPGDTVPWKKGDSNVSEKNVQHYVRDSRTGKRYTIST